MHKLDDQTTKQKYCSISY